MDIGNALRRTGRDEIVVYATIANTVKEVYNKNITIHSVSMRGKKIYVKTGNALINSELQLLSGDIKKASLKKLQAIGIHLSQDIRFLFL